MRRAQYTSTGIVKRLASVYSPQQRWMKHRADLACRIAERSGVSTIADISKDYMDMRDVYEYSSLRTRVMFITRDCRANVWSQVRIHCETHGADARENAGDVVARSSRDWVSVNRRILRAVEGLRDEDWIHVRYEDLCRDTMSSMTRVLQFAGLEYDERVLDFEQSVEHTIACNRVRFGGKMKAIREDLAWQDELRGDELQVITEICAPLATRLGYSL